MRTIKFRGKCRDDGEWVYGYLTKADAHDHAVIWEKDPVAPQYLLACDVVTETVGQYVGREDCEGNPIYEGDIIGLPSIYAKDRQGYTPFWVVEYDPWQGFKGFPREKVLGNIHDNPELMKGADDDK